MFAVFWALLDPETSFSMSKFANQQAWQSSFDCTLCSDDGTTGSKPTTGTDDGYHQRVPTMGLTND